ncbi:MAG: hypothetical protein IJT66_03975, partial [Clostridia bacterium]|nr:hypothetical protein [Clostridia bacterium]
MGSRFGGLKQIEPIGANGEILLDYSVYDAVQAGFDKVVFVIKHAIEEDFKAVIGKRIEKMVKTEYVFQETTALPDGFTCPPERQKPWGTAHAVLCCRDVVREPFAVINADDYYGKSAYTQMADFLKSGTDDYGMVGFRLCNTLTENGSVSRGVCEMENGFLKSVTERTKIIDCRYTEDDEHWIALPPDTVVSMNLWGFTPDLFEVIETGFSAFLKENLHAPKAEYYLPSVVSSLIASGQKKVRVLIAEEKWYGVTYKEDKAGVVAAIAKMTADGLYNNL